MPLTLQLHPDLEAAADAVGAGLWRDADPLAPVAVVVESHRQARWLRHRLAHVHGVCAGLVTLTLDEALDAAAACAADPDAAADGRPWWEHPARLAWTEDALVPRILEAWQRDATQPALADLRAYLGEPDSSPARWRALGLAREVAASLLALSRARPSHVAAWARGDADAPPVTPWLRATCAALGLHRDGPASWRERLRAPAGTDAPPPGASLVLLGLPLVGEADRDLVARLARTWRVAWHRPVASPARWTHAAPLPLDAFAASFQAAEEAERLAWMRRTADGAAHRLGPATAPPPADDAAPTPILACVQASLRGETATPPPAIPVPQLHACWDAAREVEALRDVLLDAFAAGRLEPRDVLVLTPDLETYAPLVQSVFARTGRGLHPERGAVAVPAIPVNIGQLGLSRTNPLAEVLLQLLALCTDRFTAAGLVALLSRGPVQRAFGLSPEDVADLGDLLRESGARWGLHAEDKVDVYGRDDATIDYAPNTLVFGLERLALGVVLPAVDDAPTPSDDPDRPPRAAMATGSRERLRAVAALSALLHALGDLRTQLRDTTPRTAAAWREVLLAALPRFARAGDTTAWLTQELRQALADALPDGTSVPLGLDAVARSLATRFELPARGDRENGSAVSLAPLGPGCATPHAFVALLGMSTGAWPRQARAAAWDPRGMPLDGEHALDVRDRHVLLEAFLSARRDVFVSWTAHEPRKGAEVPPCVPVAQLVDLLAPGVPVARVAHHPARHPWGQHHGDAGYDEAFRACAGGVAPPERADGALLPPETHPPTRLTLDTLASDLRGPSRTLLRERLGIYVAEEETPISGREPLELDALQIWQLRTALLDELRDAPATDPAAIVARHVRRLSGQGGLPLADGAADAVRDVLGGCMQQLRRAGALHDARTARQANVAITLHRAGLTLSGVVPEVCTRNGHRVHHWLTASKASSTRVLMNAWVHLLADLANGARDTSARIVGAFDGKYVSVAWLDPGGLTGPETASAVLDTLLTAWWRARRRAIPLFERSSHALASTFDAAQRKPGLGIVAACEAAVQEAWHGSRFTTGDLEDRWVRTLHAGWDPLAEMRDLDVLATPDVPPLGDAPSFCTLARAVWTPLVRCERTEGAAMRYVRHLWPS